MDYLKFDETPGAGSSARHAAEKTKEEFIKTEILLKKEKANWLRYKIMYLTLNHVLEDKRLKESIRPLNSQHNISVTSQKIIDAESEDCGLMQRFAGNAADSFLLSAMESKLKALCENLLVYHDRINAFHSARPKVKTARTFQLGEILKEERKRTEVSRQRAYDLQNEEKKTHIALLKSLLEASNSLCNILAKYKIKTQPKRTDESFENLLARCSALKLKVQTMILKLQNETYNPDNIIALQAIKSDLSKVKRLHRQEIASIEQQLLVFGGLGDDFNSMVAEYNQLQAVIEKQAWCLEKLSP